MKKNIILSAILVALLSVTYLFQEKRVEKERTEAVTQNRVLNNDLTHLKWDGVNAEKKGNQWWMGETLLSHNSFKGLEKKLLSIKSMKTVEGDPKNFFSNPFKFEVNHEPWMIGDLTLDGQGFYISDSKKIYVAFIEGESQELTTHEEEIAKIKLNELKALLSKSLNEIKEKQLFRFFDNIEFEKVSIKPDGIPEYELDFKNNTTIPAPIPGIKVHDKLRQKFLSLLTQMNIREEVPYKEELKFKKLSSMTFINDKDKRIWELWLKGKGADAVLIDSKSGKAFLMAGGTVRGFFITIQDYWDKKVIPPDIFENFTSLKAQFTQGEKSSTVTIMNREPFSFESTSYKVSPENMQLLFQIIFNLGPRDQADRVSLLSKTDRQQILSQEHLKIEVLGQDLHFWRKQEEVIVANFTQGFKAHFNFNMENFNARFEDVLK